METIVPVSGRTVRMQSGSDVRTMTEEAFLIGALAAVIPAEYEPEALKAQTVILRSSCVAGGHLEETVLENGTTGAAQESISQSSVSAVEPRIIDSNSGFSYLDKAQRKRLWGEQADVLEERCREAVRASSGYVLEWQGATVSAPFFRLSAGRTRSGTELFGQESDWCKSIACPVDEAAEDFLQEKSMKTERFFGMLEAEGVSVEKDAPKLVLTRDSAGYVLNVRAGRSSIAGERFRQLFELPSSCFFLEEQGGKMVITTKGIGHGIGFDQYYANELAKQGASAEEILELFFPGLLKKSE
ncbi:MAG: SpoIID/LytB domain-containing protein [Firmicutes bacterium]|nr:SpoIID/LytB domain-containing protein [Bacillota bacterium]